MNNNPLNWNLISRDNWLKKLTSIGDWLTTSINVIESHSEDFCRVIICTDIGVNRRRSSFQINMTQPCHFLCLIVLWKYKINNASWHTQLHLHLSSVVLDSYWSKRNANHFILGTPTHKLKKPENQLVLEFVAIKNVSRELSTIMIEIERIYPTINTKVRKYGCLLLFHRKSTKRIYIRIFSNIAYTFTATTDVCVGETVCKR